MTDARPARLAALGSPIAHSLSPALHGAAYRVLGLDWHYGTAEITSESLPSFLDSLGSDWRGLSLTMPLKRSVGPLLDSVDPISLHTGVTNTVLFDDGEGRRIRRGFNTDVYGIEQALRAAGVLTIRTAHVLGGGATAASLIVALAGLGAERIVVSVRSPERAANLVELGRGAATDVVVHPFGAVDRLRVKPDVVASTLPGSAEVDLAFGADVREHAVLFDVTYSPWPTILAARWLEVGGTVVPGIDMLIHQALLQVRIFLSGDPAQPLTDEAAVLAAMAARVGRDVGQDWRGPEPVGGF